MVARLAFPSLALRLSVREAWRDIRQTRTCEIRTKEVGRASLRLDIREHTYRRGGTFHRAFYAPREAALLARLRC
jgi:hypothetical protein